MENKKKLVAAIFIWITLLVVTYLIASYDFIEAKRIDILNNAKAELETASWEVKEKLDQRLELDSNLKKDIEFLIHSNECIKANSFTWVVADCDKLEVKEEVVKEKFLSVTWQKEKVIIKEVIKESTHKWRVNSAGISKPKAELKWNTFSEISLAHNIPVEYWYEAEKKHKIKKEVALCIAWADSWLWRYLKTKNNIWNVWNNDRWDKVSYATLYQWVEAIFKTLNNKYLWHKQSIGSLSPWGWWDKPHYATSPDNWNNNLLNCLSVIHWIPINENYLFRL